MRKPRKSGFSKDRFRAIRFSEFFANPSEAELINRLLKEYAPECKTRASAQRSILLDLAKSLPEKS